MKSAVLSKLAAYGKNAEQFISRSVPLRAVRSPRQIEFVDHADVVEMARSLAQGTMPTVSTAPGLDVQEKLTEIFGHPDLLLGPLDHVVGTLSASKGLLEQVKDSGTLAFTLLGFPHKMPNPLYTRATLPDLAEGIVVAKLGLLMEQVEQVLGVKAQITVLAENTVFHKISDISDEEQKAYLEGVQRWARELKVCDRVVIRDIADYHDATFNSLWCEITEELRSRYQKNDEQILAMVSAVMPTNFFTLWYRDYSDEILLRLFNADCADPALEELRSLKFERALHESFIYLAYHQARYRTRFMETTFPNTLRLTVSPKVGSFGVRLFHRDVELLPYYGYVVTFADSFSVRYLSEIPDAAVAVYDRSILNSPSYFKCV